MNFSRPQSFTQTFRIEHLLSKAVTWLIEPWCKYNPKLSEHLTRLLANVGETIFDQIDEEPLYVHFHREIGNKGRPKQFRPIDFVTGLVLWYIRITTRHLEEREKQYWVIKQGLIEGELEKFDYVDLDLNYLDLDLYDLKCSLSKDPEWNEDLF